MSGQSLKIVYMGSSSFSVPALDALCRAGHRIALVVTQPDRVRGRGGKIMPTPVGLYAAENSLPLCMPESLKTEEGFLRKLDEVAPDLIVVASYGKLLPKSLLVLPRLGCVNIHASLLPEYRGAAPVQRAILDGRRETGVTLMYMAEELDKGDMIASLRTDIEDKNAGELTDELAILGARLLLNELPALADGTARSFRQDEAKATYAEKIQKADGRLDLNEAAETAVRRVRAMTPAPGAWVMQGVLRIVITSARAAGLAAGVSCEAREKEAPGTVLNVSKDGIDVRTGNGVLVIKALKMPGKKAMPVAEFLKGNVFNMALPLE